MRDGRIAQTMSAVSCSPQDSCEEGQKKYDDRYEDDEQSEKHQSAVATPTGQLTPVLPRPQ